MFALFMILCRLELDHEDTLLSLVVKSRLRSLLDSAIKNSYSLKVKQSEALLDEAVGHIIEVLLW